MTLRMIETYILEALAVFQYLTAKQLLDILPLTGIASVNRYLRILKSGKGALVKQLEF